MQSQKKEKRVCRFAVGAGYGGSARFLGMVLLCGMFLYFPHPSAGGKAYAAERKHGLSMYGALKHGTDFKHFDYVNPNAPKGGTLKRGGFGTFDSLNSFILKGNAAEGLPLVYDTLLTKGKDEAFSEYGLLAQYVELSSPKAKGKPWVTFHLHPKARFSDGKPVTAEDVVFTFKALTTGALPLYASYYGDVESVRALSKRKVRFTFKHANNAELPLILGQLQILPKHYWKGKDFNAVTLDVPIGSGPYLVDEVKPGRSISYKRNPNYWGKELPVNKGRHNFDRIEYVYYRDLTIMHEAFKSGEIDVKAENQAKRWEQGYNFPAVKRGDVIKKKFAHRRNQGMQAFVFNTRNPAFASVKTREALNYAYDFEWANKNLFYNGYARSYSYFSNSEMAACCTPKGDELKILEPYRAKLPARLFTEEPRVIRSDGKGGMRANLRTALNILKEDGWQLKDGKLLKKGKQMKIEILLVQKAFERIVNPFIQNLKRLGIDANLRIVDTSQYIDRLRTFKFDMLVYSFAQSASPGNEQRNFWGSIAADQPGSRNVAGIKDPVIDELIEKLIQAPSRKALIDHVRALDRVLLWNFYVIPQWHISSDRIAYWDKFGYPEKIPLSGVELDTWWAKSTDK